GTVYRFSSSVVYTVTVLAARFTANRYGYPSWASSVMPSSAYWLSSDSISVLPASSQVLGSVTSGASLVALELAVAITRELSGVSVGAGVGVAVAVGTGVGVTSGSFSFLEQPASIVTAS